MLRKLYLCSSILIGLTSVPTRAGDTAVVVQPNVEARLGLQLGVARARETQGPAARVSLTGKADHVEQTAESTITGVVVEVSAPVGQTVKPKQALAVVERSTDRLLPALRTARTQLRELQKRLAAAQAEAAEAARGKSSDTGELRAKQVAAIVTMLKLDELGLEATVKALEKELNGLKENEQGKVTILSPRGGLVVAAPRVGDMALAGLPLWRVRSNTWLRCRFEVVGQRDVSLLEAALAANEGLAFSVTLNGGTVVSGKLQSIQRHRSAVICATASGYIDNGRGALKAGDDVTAEVEVPLASLDAVIPESAVVKANGRSYVVVKLEGEGKYEVREVAVMRQGGGVAHVRPAAGSKAVRPGNQVVTKNAVELVAFALEQEEASRR